MPHRGESLPMISVLTAAGTDTMRCARVSDLGAHSPRVWVIAPRDHELWFMESLRRRGRLHQHPRRARSPEIRRGTRARVFPVPNQFVWQPPDSSGFVV